MQTKNIWIKQNIVLNVFHMQIIYLHITNN